MSDLKKLKKLKKIRRDNLEKNLLDVQLKGYDHYIFFNERGKAQVISNGNWIKAVSYTHLTLPTKA